MPSVTMPGLSTAPTGVTSFVSSFRVIALLAGSAFWIRLSTGVLRFGAGVVPPGGDELRLAGGGTCVWASAAATKIAGASIATSSANVFMCQPSCGGRGVVVRLSPHHEMSAVSALLAADRRVRERLGYFVLDAQHGASFVLNVLVIVLHRVVNVPQVRIR